MCARGIIKIGRTKEAEREPAEGWERGTLWRYGPRTVGAAGLVAFLAFLVLAPVNFVRGVSATTLTFISLNVAAFLLGTFVVEWARLGHGKYSRRQIGPSFYKVVVIAAVGILLRVYDRFIVRGVSIQLDALTNREMLETAGVNIFALWGGLLYPFCFVPLFIVFGKQERSPLKVAVAAVLFLYPVFDTFVIGGRSLILVTLSMLLLCLSYGGYTRRHRRLFVFALPSSLLVVIFFFTSIFLDRLNLMGTDIQTSIFYSAYAFTVEPKPWLLEYISELDMLSTLLFGVLHVSQYVTHGLFELDYLIANYSVDGIHAWGANQYVVFAKALSLMFAGGFDPLLAFRLQPRTGIFTTFLGPAWVDFGWFAVLHSFAFGAAAHYVWRRSALAGGGAFVPLYAFLCVVIFFAPVVNFFAVAQGIYLLTALSLFVVLHRIGIL